MTMKWIDSIIHWVFPRREASWEERAVVFTLLACLSFIVVFAL